MLCMGSPLVCRLPPTDQMQIGVRFIGDSKCALECLCMLALQYVGDPPLAGCQSELAQAQPPPHHHTWGLGRDPRGFHKRGFGERNRRGGITVILRSISSHEPRQCPFSEENCTRLNVQVPVCVCICVCVREID